MTKADAMAPIVALEGTVVAGRTYQAYKRGKWDEARERFIEETGTTKAVHLTLITTRGLAHNSHSDIFQNVVVAESLFEK